MNGADETGSDSGGESLLHEGEMEGESLEVEFWCKTPYKCGSGLNYIFSLKYSQLNLSEILTDCSLLLMDTIDPVHRPFPEQRSLKCICHTVLSFHIGGARVGSYSTSRPLGLCPYVFPQARLLERDNAPLIRSKTRGLSNFHRVRDSPGFERNKPRLHRLPRKPLIKMFAE